MSEFEKELMNKVSPHDRTFKGHELFLGGFLLEHFKDWQPPKPREIPVEIPQLVAVWFEDRMLGSFSAVVASYSFSDDEAITWVHDNGGLDLLCKMKLYGYTVEKEKKYILKHIDLSEQDDCVSVYLARHPYAKLKHDNYSKGFDMSEIEQCHFTQEEIDKLNIGSYEQMPVEMSDNGI